MSEFLIGSGANGGNKYLGLWTLQSDGTFQFSRNLCAEFNFKATWFQLSKNGDFLFSVGENNETVSSFRIIREEGARVADLELLSTTSAGGICPCHLDLLADGSGLLVANYTSGTVSLLPVSSDGILSELLFTIDHNVGLDGKVAHAHQVIVSRIRPNIVYVCDLGSDSIYTYSLSSVGTNKWLTLLGQEVLPLGSGPRHLVINSAGTCAYIVSELKNTVCAISIDPDTQCVTSGDEDVVQHCTLCTTQLNIHDMAASEILLSADDRFLYISNRDICPDRTAIERSSIAVFLVGADGRSMSLIQQVSSRGRHPRHMCLTHGGTRLVVANRITNTLVTFRVDLETGLIDEASVITTDCAEHCLEPSFMLEI